MTKTIIKRLKTQSPLWVKIYQWTAGSIAIIYEVVVRTDLMGFYTLLKTEGLDVPMWLKTAILCSGFVLQTINKKKSDTEVEKEVEK